MKKIDIIGYTRAEIIKMENGKMPLPTGVSKMGSGKSGYRLHRTINGKTYRFGTFQNLEHALKTNAYIGRLVDDIRKELDSRPLTVDDLDKALDAQYLSILIQFKLLNEQILNLSDERKPFWQRVFGR